eukprot:gene1033-1120_t
MEEVYEEILTYWFGGDQRVNYRTKWFPESSTGQQAATDQYIFDHFHLLLVAAMEGQLIDWEKKIRSSIALIILLDQFSRHVFRHQGLPADHPHRQQADQEALRIAWQLQNNHGPDIILLPMAQYIFALMPLRHTPSYDHLKYVLTKLDEKESLEEHGVELLARFRKQTLRRFQHLEDRAKAEASDEILERAYCPSDESDIYQNILLTTTADFLRKYFPQAVVEDVTGAAGKKRLPIKTIQKERTINVVMISLSGGVDSMVLSKILALLRDSATFQIDRVIAMHIDYSNRPESIKERLYIEYWCREVLGIDLKVRVISEARRGVTDREEYEKVTRQIRYQFYETCIQEAMNSLQEEEEGGKKQVVKVSGVVFGHHQGDVQENVISNVMRGSSPLHLSGMTEVSIANNVTIWRPLLSHPKSTIYTFAHRYGIPYFKDSTPSWSTRGQLRNTLLPALIQVYGTGALHNLSALAKESDDLRRLVQDNLYDPFLRSVRYFPCGLKVPISNTSFRNQSASFWREGLKQMMHSMGMALVRDKAVLNFVERLEKEPLPVGYVELRKGVHSILTAQGELLVLRSLVLREEMTITNPSTTANQLKQRRAGGSKEKRAKRRQHRQANQANAVKEGNNKDVLDVEEGDFLQEMLTNATLESAVTIESSSANDVSQAEESNISSVHVIKEYKVAIDVLVDSKSNVVQLQFDHDRLVAWEKDDYTTFVSTNKGIGMVDDQLSSVRLGPWLVTVKMISLSVLPQERLLTNLEDIVEGSFAFHVILPSAPQGRLVLLYDAVNSVEEEVEDNTRFSSFADLQPWLSLDLRGMEVRLRDGLPLLVPGRCSAMDIEDADINQVVLQLQYTYISPMSS